MRHSNRQRFQTIHRELLELNRLLSRYLEIFSRPNRIFIRFEDVNAMPQTLSVNQKITATAAEYDAAGSPVEPAATSLAWSLSDSNIASIETNPDGTATITANAEGSVTVFVKDASNSLSASDVLTITPAAPDQPSSPVTPTTTEPGVAVSIAIEFGTPA